MTAIKINYSAIHLFQHPLGTFFGLNKAKEGYEGFNIYYTYVLWIKAKDMKDLIFTIPTYFGLKRRIWI